jgi:hypothetical protein
MQKEKFTSKEKHNKKVEEIEDKLGLGSGDFYNEEKIEDNIVLAQQINDNKLKNRDVVEKLIMDCFQKDNYEASSVFRYCADYIFREYKKTLGRPAFDLIFGKISQENTQIMETMTLQTQQHIISSGILEIKPDADENYYVTQMQVINSRLLLEFANAKNDGRDLVMFSKAIKDNVMTVKAIKGFGDKSDDEIKDLDIPTHAWILNINNTINNVQEDKNIIDISEDNFLTD